MTDRDWPVCDCGRKLVYVIPGDNRQPYYEFSCGHNQRDFSQIAVESADVFKTNKEEKENTWAG